MNSMVSYLVTAKPVEKLMKELHDKLQSNAFAKTYFQARMLTYILSMARKDGDNVVFESPDYCILPHTKERAEVINTYFTEIHVEVVTDGEGWLKISELPRLFPDIEAALEERPY